MEEMVMGLVKMLTTKVGTYELKGMDVESKIDTLVPLNDEGLNAKINMDIKMKVESLVITIDNNSLKKEA